MRKTSRPTLRIIAAGLTTGSLLIGTLWGSLGCSSTGADRSAKTAAIAPSDFIAQADASQNTAPGQPSAATGGDTAAASSDPADSAEAGNAHNAAERRPSQAISINAMVGHINGEAVYADQIFDVNVIAQLETFGRRFDNDEFLRNAFPVIEQRLRGVIIDKLILGEAELNLKDKERQALDGRVRQEREELMRFYGQGSISKARAEFRKDRGVEMDRYLMEFRDELAIGVYIRAKVFPKISISQINIENYYEDNLDKYNTPDMRAFRMIRASDDATAQAVKARLDRGESFERVATDEAVNTYNAEGAGVFNNGELYPGDIGIGPVNEALQSLSPNQHAGPIVAGNNHYFIYLDRFEPGENVSLGDAQVDIEKALRALEFERQVLRFRASLYERGNFSDPTRMSQKLLEIAQARYDR